MGIHINLGLVICSWYCIISSSVAYLHKKTMRYCIKKFFFECVRCSKSVWCESITVSIFASYQSYCSSFPILQFPSAAKFHTNTNRYIWNKTFCFSMKDISVWYESARAFHISRLKNSSSRLNAVRGLRVRPYGTPSIPIFNSFIKGLSNS